MGLNASNIIVGSGPNAPSDANLSTSDITTNNASTTKHGFLKKLSNVATEFMNGAGNWATPTGGSYQFKSSSAVTGAAAQQLDSGTLDLDTDGSYYIEIYSKGAGAGAFEANLYVNDDVTDANYYRNTLIMNGNSIMGEQDASAKILHQPQGTSDNRIYSGWVRLDNSDKLVANIISEGDDNYPVINGSVRSAGTHSNITKINFKSSVAGSLAIGTTMYIYKLAKS